MRTLAAVLGWCIAVGIVGGSLVASAPGPASAGVGEGAGRGLAPDRHWRTTFATEFRLEACRFADRGSAPYFVLEPGYRLVLEGEVDGSEITVETTVLDETEVVDGVSTRVVEDREYEDGELVEVSRNFFALCEPTADVVYFGEDVDIYEGGQIVSHEGAWRAGRDGARPGLLLPGRPVVGARYYQELAPGAALDRAEVIDVLESFEVDAGRFDDVVFLYETSGLDPTDESFKFFAPGVGLVKDDDLELVDYGFVGPP